MDKSETKDVSQFLAAFVDVVMGNGVRLAKGCWADGSSNCLLGELIHRSYRPAKGTYPTDEAALLLGITRKEVEDIVDGWDGVRGSASFVRMGRSLRARYERRWR